MCVGSKTMTENKTEAQAAGEANKRQREFVKRLGFIGWRSAKGFFF